MKETITSSFLKNIWQSYRGNPVENGIPEFKYGKQFGLGPYEWPPQLVITTAQYAEHLRECDGICQLCHTWSDGIAEPLGENIHCAHCSNNTVVGINKAITMILVRMTWSEDEKNRYHLLLSLGGRESK